MHKILKWWYIGWVTIFIFSVLAMATCTLAHWQTREERLLEVSNYGFYAVITSLAAFAVPLLVKCYHIAVASGALHAMGSRLTQPSPDKKE